MFIVLVKINLNKRKYRLHKTYNSLKSFQIRQKTKQLSTLFIPLCLIF